MTDLQKIRFITSNFSILQGLKLVPLGLFLAYASAFNDAQIGRETRDLTIPCLITPVLIVLYVLIHFYYQRTYGRVEHKSQFGWKEAVLDAGVLAIAWAAFAVDSLDWMPVSFFALFFGMALLLTQAWMVRQAGYKTPAIFPAGLVCIALVFFAAFLPLLGEKFSELFGFRSEISLAGAAVGILYAIYGVLAHLFLVRSLAPSREVDQEQSA